MSSAPNRDKDDLVEYHQTIPFNLAEHLKQNTTVSSYPNVEHRSENDEELVKVTNQRFPQTNTQWLQDIGPYQPTSSNDRGGSGHGDEPVELPAVVLEEKLTRDDSNLSKKKTRADLFAQDYDSAMRKLHHPIALAVLDVIAFFGLLFKMVWPAVYPFVDGAPISKTPIYLPLLALTAICVFPFLIWPVSYIGVLRRYSGMAPSIIFHIGYTVSNIILLVKFDHNFWWLLLMDIPLFVHSFFVFAWQNYQMHIDGSEHRRFIMNAYVTRPVQHLQMFLFVFLEYLDTYQGYYIYWAHKEAANPIRASYIAFASINSFLIPVIFIISSSIGSTTPNDWILKTQCCGCIYDMRRHFALNLIDFLTDVPIIIIKSIDFRRNVTGWFNILLYVFNIVMCLKSLAMGVFGVFLVFMFGCDNDCYDCTKMCNNLPMGDYRLKEVKRVFKVTPWKFYIMCPLLPCFLYRDSFCNCLPDWIGKQIRVDLANSVKETEIDCKAIPDYSKAVVPHRQNTFLKE